MNKNETLAALEGRRAEFMQAIEGLSEETLQQAGIVGEWSVKDIMSHLLAWETELVKLLWQVQMDEKPTTEQFSKVHVDKINQKFFNLTHDRDLERVMADFAAVRNQTIRRVKEFSEKDFEDPNRFPALGSNPLSEWIANDSFGHEKEHIEQIKTWRVQHGI